MALGVHPTASSAGQSEESDQAGKSMKLARSAASRLRIRSINMPLI
jgi:hypothetical protein